MASEADLPQDLLTLILSAASPFAVSFASCTCKRWYAAAASIDTSLIAVVASGSNELLLLCSRGNIVQRIKALPAAQRRSGGHHRVRSIIPSIKPMTATVYNWPTCICAGPGSSLLLSQYRLPGVLQFERYIQGFRFARVAAKHNHFTAPEGVVYAHDSCCCYLVTVESGLISRLKPAGSRGGGGGTSAGGSLAGPLAVCESSGPYVGPDGERYTMWGMTLGPDGNLYVAAHVADDLAYTQPTSEDTGCILRQLLDPTTGSFTGGLHVFAFRGHDVFAGALLNRPSDPRFCSHGVLHVSSYARGRHGLQLSDRLVYKIDTAFSAFPGRPAGSLFAGYDEGRAHRLPHRLGTIIGYLKASGESASLIKHAWGISASPSDLSMCVTCHGEDAPAPVVRLQTCGCAAAGLTLAAATVGFIRPFSCGEAQAVTTSPVQAPNCVLHIR